VRKLSKYYINEVKFFQTGGNNPVEYYPLINK